MLAFALYPTLLVLALILTMMLHEAFDPKLLPKYDPFALALSGFIGLVIYFVGLQLPLEPHTWGKCVIFAFLALIGTFCLMGFRERKRRTHVSDIPDTHASRQTSMLLGFIIAGMLFTLY